MLDITETGPKWYTDGMESLILAIPTDSTYGLPLAPLWLAVTLIVIALVSLVLSLVIAHAFVEGGPGSVGGFMFFLGASLALGMLGYVSFHERLTTAPAPEVTQSQEASQVTGDFMPAQTT